MSQQVIAGLSLLPDHNEFSPEANLLFRQHQAQIWRFNDRLFAALLMIEWVAGIATALWISPRAWEGSHHYTHPHVWAAVLLGGLITLPPAALAMLRPGSALTRQTIAIAQMLFSALLIHLSGGRLETHFHVFGSLAFLAFYRDWRVLLTATIVVALDHMARGLFWPQSVFGTVVREPWRWAEHAGWVFFEDAFLLLSCRAGVMEMQAIARRQAEREKMYRQQEISRRAGMAEVATSVLHNVGNVLTSVNVSITLLADQLRQSKVPNLVKAAHMLGEHEHDLAHFVTAHEKGRQIPGYLMKLSDFLGKEQATMLDEVESLAKNVDHIKHVVALQQSYASASGVVESVNLVELVEDALRVNLTSIQRHRFVIHREFASVPKVSVDKHKVIQILVNLVSNAMHATKVHNGPAGTPVANNLRLRIERANHPSGDADRVRLQVIDSGVGIEAANLAKIFTHGFTTRTDGHGFGLHYCANAAREMGGSLTASSGGHGQGATFTLELPVKRVGTLT